MPPSLPRKILIVRLGAIGDVTNALVLASALEAADRGVTIGWAVHELSRPLVEGHPAVDRMHVWRRADGLAGARAVLREVRRERYDLAIDLQRILKSALLARLSGAPRVLGFDRGRAKEWSWLLSRERIAAGPRNAHMVEQYLAFARHLGLADARPNFALPADPAAEGWAEQLVRELGRAPILVHVGASQPAKRWIPERFGDVAREAARRFARPVLLTGGPSDRDDAAQAFARAGGEPRVRNLAGETSLVQLIALARRASALVTPDSGPMHIAVALGRPVVALFGPGDPERTGPYGRAASVLREPPPCAPCGLRVCNQPRHLCMEALDAERVLAKLAQVLEQER